ncbi:FtsX-like permease family protein [Carnobacterium gallinarum]|uniref:ABC transporter permease n=1 Tax=Carnobacterium gallinarum TaxID=2749 RepID=UPI00055802CF|nr:ABC transporter permease [Carnobacterium gallinarum]
MNFIKRALLSTKAKKGRSFMLLLVFSAILIFVLAGITIQSASKVATTEARKSMGSSVTLGVNRENTLKKTETTTDSSTSTTEEKRPTPGSYQSTPVDLDTATKIAALENVKSYNFISTTSAGADSFDPISSSDSTDSSTAESSTTETQQKGGPDGNGMSDEAGGAKFGPGAAQGDLNVQGVLSTADLAAFTDGTSKLTSGEALTKEDVDKNVVLVEQSLAEANELKVGDTITISNPTDETATYELTIKGIYETTTSDNAMAANFNFLNPSNQIYVPYTFANTLKGDTYANGVDSVIYNLDDPENVASFVTSAESTGLDTTTFSLQTDTAVYEQMIQPIENVSSFANKIVILVTVAGVIILALIIMMTIRERKYEMGVLLSLGEKRWKLIAQFFTEIFVIFLVAMCVAGVSGKFVGNVVGQQLLDQQTTETTTSSTDTNSQNGGQPGQGGPGGNQRGGGMGGFGNLGATNAATAKKIDELNITVSTADLVKLGGIGLGICFLSILISSVGIVRLQPKKILTM